MKDLLRLVLCFAKMGVLTFGGGYAMLPLARRELIEKRRWVTEAELVDYFAIAMVTPGIIAVNLCTFVGFSRKGVLGGICATLAFCAIPVTLIVCLAFVMEGLADNEMAAHALAGVRIAVAALIVNTALNMAKTAVKDWKQAVIALAVFVWALVFKASPTVMVIAAGCAGFLFYARAKN